MSLFGIYQLSHLFFDRLGSASRTIAQRFRTKRQRRDDLIEVATTTTSSSSNNRKRHAQLIEIDDDCKLEDGEIAIDDGADQRSRTKKKFRKPVDL